MARLDDGDGILPDDVQRPLAGPEDYLFDREYFWMLSVGCESQRRRRCRGRSKLQMPSVCALVL